MPQLFRVGPEGDIDTKAGFRVGVLSSSTDSSVSRGDVLIDLYTDA